MRMKNRPSFITDCSSPGGLLARGGVPNIIGYIYAPSPTPPISEDAKQILPLTGDAAALARALMPEWSHIGGWGVVSWSRMLRHGESYTPRKTTNYITWGTFPTRDAPQKMTVRSWYVFGMMPMSILTTWHHNFDNDIISHIQQQLQVVVFLIILYLNTDKAIV